VHVFILTCLFKKEMPGSPSNTCQPEDAEPHTQAVLGLYRSALRLDPAECTRICMGNTSWAGCCEQRFGMTFSQPYERHSKALVLEVQPAWESPGGFVNTCWAPPSQAI
jgi:hypothetical protein